MTDRRRTAPGSALVGTAQEHQSGRALLPPQRSRAPSGEYTPRSGSYLPAPASQLQSHLDFPAFITLPPAQIRFSDSFTLIFASDTRVPTAFDPVRIPVAHSPPGSRSSLQHASPSCSTVRSRPFPCSLNPHLPNGRTTTFRTPNLIIRPVPDADFPQHAVEHLLSASGHLFLACAAYSRSNLVSNSTITNS